MVTNILDYLEQTAQRLPEKTALADDKLNLTFGQWVQQAESIGTAIAQATNTTIRRAVLVFVDRRVEGLVGAMGVVESGNFYVPIDCKMPYERVRLIADVCNPIAAVATTEADLKTLDQIDCYTRRASCTIAPSAPSALLASTIFSHAASTAF